MLPIFLHGIIVGLFVAAPLGPAGLLCVHRTISNGWRAGFISALGIACADGLFGGLAAFGLTAIPGLFAGYELWLRIAGGVFLIVIGIRLMRTPLAASAEEKDAGTVWRTTGASFVTAISNPLTLPSFIVIFAATGLTGAHTDSVPAAVTVALGVFLGFLLWWLVLSALIDTMRERFTPRLVHRINRVTGVIIVGCGIAALLWFHTLFTLV